MRRLTVLFLGLSACEPELTRQDLISAPCGPDAAFASAVGCARCEQVLVPTVGTAVDLALRIQPAATPFVVEQVGYFVEGDVEGCDAGRPHTLRLHRTSGLPPNQPEDGLVFEAFQTRLPYRFIRPVVVTVDPPIQLESADSLYLVLDLAEETGPGLCLRACETALVDTDFVSTLSEFGAWLDGVEDSNLTINVQAFARGRSP
ncbi:MAG: hypothetical protein AAGD10_05000 [Myxococcota bacterium]